MQSGKQGFAALPFLALAFSLCRFNFCMKRPRLSQSLSERGRGGLVMSRGG